MMKSQVASTGPLYGEELTDADLDIVVGGLATELPGPASMYDPDSAPASPRVSADSSATRPTS